MKVQLHVARPNGPDQVIIKPVIAHPKLPANVAFLHIQVSPELYAKAAYRCEATGNAYFSRFDSVLLVSAKQQTVTFMPLPNMVTPGPVIISPAPLEMVTITANYKAANNLCWRVIELFDGKGGLSITRENENGVKEVLNVEHDINGSACFELIEGDILGIMPGTTIIVKNLGTGVTMELSSPEGPYTKEYKVQVFDEQTPFQYLGDAN